MRDVGLTAQPPYHPVPEVKLDTSSASNPSFSTPPWRPGGGGHRDSKCPIIKVYWSGFLFSRRAGQERRPLEWIVMVPENSLIWAAAETPAITSTYVIVSECRNPPGEVEGNPYTALCASFFFNVLSSCTCITTQKKRGNYSST